MNGGEFCPPMRTTPPPIYTHTHTYLCFRERERERERERGLIESEGGRRTTSNRLR